MSVATIGAVGLTDTDLIIPGVPQIPYALLLTGAGSTTEVIEVRSLQRGGHVYVTRGAFGSLPVAHTAPVVVTLYDPNSGGGGGGGGVTVTGSQSGSVAGATSVLVPGTVAEGDPGQAVVGLLLQFRQATINFNDSGIETGPRGVQLFTISAGSVILAYWITSPAKWEPHSSDTINPDVFIEDAADHNNTDHLIATNERPDLTYQGVIQGTVTDQAVMTQSDGVAASIDADDGTRYMPLLIRADATVRCVLSASPNPMLSGTSTLNFVIATPAS